MTTEPVAAYSEAVSGLPAKVDLDAQTQQKRGTLTANAAALSVHSPKSYEYAAGLLAGLKALRREIEEHFSRIKKPLNALRSAVLDLEKERLDPVKQAETIVGAKMLAFRTEQEQARREEEARARAEAEARAEMEAEARAEALRRAAAQVAIPEIAAALTQQAEAVETAPTFAPPVHVPSTVPEVKGVFERETWSAEVTDLLALVRAVAAGEVPLDALTPNGPWLNRQAQALRGLLSLPGVRPVQSKTLVSRR